MAVRISCINKDDRYNPYEAITHVGGVVNGERWKLTQKEAITAIKSGQYQFYVDVNNDPAKVVVATSPYGNEYLKTEADGDRPNNLLSLAECPI